MHASFLFDHILILPATPAMMYNGINGGIEHLRPDGESDHWNSIAAASLTGAVFKATGLLFCSNLSHIHSM